MGELRSCRNPTSRSSTSPDNAAAGDAIGFITFSRPDRVYLDACHVADGFHPGPVTTLDGLAAALYEQRGWADVTAPSDITIDGHPGKMFQRAAPAVLSDCPNGYQLGTMRLPSTDGAALKKLAERRRFESSAGTVTNRANSRPC